MKEIGQQHAPKDIGEQFNNTALATSKFLEDTWQHPAQRLNQAAAITEGVVVGGMKTAYKECTQRPVETATKAGLAVIGGVALGCEIPAIATAAVVAGAAMSISYGYDFGQRLGSDQLLKKALLDVWNGKEVGVLQSKAPVFEHALGSDAFNLALNTLAGGAGFRLGRLGAAACSQFSPVLEYKTATAGEMGLQSLIAENRSRGPLDMFALASKKFEPLESATARKHSAKDITSSTTMNDSELAHIELTKRADDVHLLSNKGRYSEGSELALRNSEMHDALAARAANTTEALAHQAIAKKFGMVSYLLMRLNVSKEAGGTARTAEHDWIDLNLATIKTLYARDLK